MLTYFYVYLVLAVVPVWFISYSTIRMGRHWNDGKDKFILVNRHVYFKWLLSFLMMLLTSMHIIDLIIFTDIAIIDTISRLLFFSLLLISWFISFVLGIFENNKRLIMRWSGHRSFWPANVLVHIVLMVGDGIYFFDASFSYNWVLILEAVYFCQIVSCFILTIYAIRRPNEFLIIDDMDFTFLRRSTRKTMLGSSSSDSFDHLKTSIKSYKIKQEEGKTIIYFNIASTTDSKTFITKKTIQEFDALNHHIYEAFPSAAYPNMSIPSLNILPTQELEDKVTILNEYLNSLSLPEFYSQYFLDFLGITGKQKNVLLKQHEEIMKNEENIERSEFRSGMRSGSIAERYFNPTITTDDTFDEGLDHQSNQFIHITIPKWIEVYNHIEYQINWSTNNNLGSGTICKRYKDILEFHKALTKLVAPAKLPDFPSKNYLKKLNKIDKKALSQRKTKLEVYLNHVFNDVAYLSNDSLTFLEIPLSLNNFWCIQSNIEVKIEGKFHVSPVIDDDGYHLVYDIKLSKYQDKIKKHEWSISRRYRQFDILQESLLKRSQSPILSSFNEATCINDSIFPSLPSKSVSKILSLPEINSRKQGLESYLEELLLIPGILQAYILRQFIEDPEVNETFKIN